MPLKDLLAGLPEDFKFKAGETELDRAALLAELEKEFTPLNTKVTELTAVQQQLKEERDAAIAAAALRTDDGNRKTDDRTPEQIAQDALLALVDKKNQYNFADPYSTQLLDRVEKIVKDALGGTEASRKAELDELKNGMLGTTAIALMLQMNSEFAKHEWPEGYDASKAWGEAIKNGYINPQTRLPDIARFNKDVMAPTREKKAAEKAREEGIAEGRRLAAEEQQQRQTGRGRLGLVPRPAGGGGGGAKGGAAKAPRTLAEAIDSIQVTDADIAANAGLRVGG